MEWTDIFSCLSLALYGLATVESVDYGPEAIVVVAMADAKARGQLRAYAVDDEPKKKEDWE